MFTVIEVIEKNQGILEKLISKFIPAQPELIKVAVKSGAPYFVIRASDSKKIPWDEITYMAGRCSTNILVNKDIPIPSELEKRRFVPKFLPLVMLSNTATDILSAVADKISIGINDPNAVLANKLSDYVHFSSEITVTTDNTELYRGKCEELMEDCGISVVLARDKNRLKNCNVVISENATEASVCFTLSADGMKNAFEFSDFALPPVYDLKLPIGIEKDVFASALYELCGVRRLGSMKFQKVRINEETMTVEELKNGSASKPTRKTSDKA